MTACSNPTVVCVLYATLIGWSVPVEMPVEFFTLPASEADFSPRLQVMVTGPPVLLPDLPAVVPGKGISPQ